MDAIQSFINIVETGSLSGAAKKMGISVSTISRQITTLEERLRLKLLIRSTRKIVLTEDGNAYYASVKEILNELNQLENQLKDKNREPSGDLHISAPTLWGRNHLVPMLSDFMMQYPKINLTVTLLDRPVSLLDEGIDIAIRVGTLEDSSLLCRTLGHIRWVLCASPRYLEKNGTPLQPDHLMQHTCLIYSQNKHGNEWEFQGKNSKRKIKVPVRMRSNSLDAVVTASLKGAGIVMTPKWFVDKQIQQKELVILMPEYELPARPIYALFTHNHLMTNKVRVLLDYLIFRLEQIYF
ncbi:MULTISPECIES: LysR family transcriptional regulator [unclassified Acinetobacter]|uniref:LysR family transcriptional regulator n=1 Tax=unclassified Acinetobacter TaxID=196816 RepID=UPI00190A0956|nr:MULTISPECIES: LysR family transcriptional regulator [unclassified Acinetobacter]MBK0062294.1 LysR family transcriptional regulator [Acinetobacter sp. S55]MBK0066098.1 LysR family transcriptional regulator [Acinetobacter sp. S54]